MVSTTPVTEPLLKPSPSYRKGKYSKAQKLNWATFTEVEQTILAKNIRKFFPSQCNVSFYHPFLEVYARNNLQTKRLNHQYRLVEVQDVLQEYDIHVKQYLAQIVKKCSRGGISFETRHVVIKEIPLLPINLLTVYNQQEHALILPTGHSRSAIQYLYSPENPAYLELMASYLCSHLVETQDSPHFTLLYGTAGVLLKYFTYQINDQSSPYLDESRGVRKYIKNDKLHLVIPRVPVQLIFQESIKFCLDDVLQVGEYCSKIWKSYLFQVLAALSLVNRRYNLCHNDLHTGNIMYSLTKHKYLHYSDVNGTIYRVPTYGKIIKIIDWGRATFKYRQRNYRNHCFGCEGEAFSQYNWADDIIPSKPVQTPKSSNDIILFVHSLATSQDKLPKDPVSQFINNTCELPVVGNVITKHRTLNFKLYEDVSKYSPDITADQLLKHPLFRNYITPRLSIPENTSVYKLE